MHKQTCQAIATLRVSDVLHPSERGSPCSGRGYGDAAVLEVTPSTCSSSFRPLSPQQHRRQTPSPDRTRSLAWDQSCISTAVRPSSASVRGKICRVHTWYRNTRKTTSSRKHASLCSTGILIQNLQCGMRLRLRPAEKRKRTRRDRRRPSTATCRSSLSSACVRRSAGHPRQPPAETIKMGTNLELVVND